MTTPSPLHAEKMRRAIQTAAAELRHAEWRLAQRTGPPAPGDVYAFAHKFDAALEWLVVLPHPSEPDQFFVIPADDFPQAGTPDLVLTRELTSRPLTLRCGQGMWVSTARLAGERRVGVLPDEALRQARAMIADLALGRLCGTEEQRAADMDSEYQSWLQTVEHVRERMQEAIDRGPILLIFDRNAWAKSPVPTPPTPEPRPRRSMAQGGEPAPRRDSAQPAPDAGPCYHPLPCPGPGRLWVMADDQGVRVLWAGEQGEPPTLRAKDRAGHARPARWDALPQGSFRVSGTVSPWIDGQVELSLGSSPSRKVTIRR